MSLCKRGMVSGDAACTEHCLCLMEQEVLTGCDVTAMVLQYPRAFLEKPQQEMVQRLMAVDGLLRDRLQGADIDVVRA